MASITPFKQPLEPSFRIEELSGQGGSNHTAGYDVFAEDSFEMTGSVRPELTPPAPSGGSTAKVPWWMPAWVMAECLILLGAVLLLLSGAF